MEQRAQGTLRIWAELFVALRRTSKLFNLRTDSFERADITSNSYYDWFIDNDYIALAATAVMTCAPGDLQGVPRHVNGRPASPSTRSSPSSRTRSRRPLARPWRRR